MDVIGEQVTTPLDWAGLKDETAYFEAADPFITSPAAWPNCGSETKSTCSLPLTAAVVVDMVITELALFGWRNGRLTLLELMPGAILADVKAKTTAEFVLAVEEQSPPASYKRKAFA